jgi:uncharacterized membrane protein
MQRCLGIKIAVLTLVLAVGFTLVSGQAGQVYAATSHYTGGHSGSHTGDPGHGYSGHHSNGGGGYYGGWYNGGNWFVPAYPYYSCPPGYQYNPNVYNPNMYPPYCQPITP